MSFSGTDGKMKHLDTAVRETLLWRVTFGLPQIARTRLFWRSYRLRHRQRKPARNVAERDAPSASTQKETLGASAVAREGGSISIGAKPPTIRANICFRLCCSSQARLMSPEASIMAVANFIRCDFHDETPRQTISVGATCSNWGRYRIGERHSKLHPLSLPRSDHSL